MIEGLKNEEGIEWLSFVSTMTMRDYFAAHAAEQDIAAEMRVFRPSETNPETWYYEEMNLTRVQARYAYADKVIAASLEKK